MEQCSSETAQLYETVRESELRMPICHSNLSGMIHERTEASNGHAEVDTGI